jgi:hypothetical protein
MVRWAWWTAVSGGQCTRRVLRVFVSIRVGCLDVGGKYREFPGGFYYIIFTTVSLRAFLRDFLFASLLFHGAGAVLDNTGPTVIEEGYMLGFSPLLLRDSLFSLPM